MTETHVVNWAGLTGDFYPLHMDREYAAKTQFGERLVHGPFIFALAVGLVAQAGFAGTPPSPGSAWTACACSRR